MSQTEVPEGVVNLAHALVETQHLRAWFYALERLPVSFREAAFSEMAAQMRSVGEDSSLADAVASPRIRRCTKAYWRQFESVSMKPCQTSAQNLREVASAQGC